MRPSRRPARRRLVGAAGLAAVFVGGSASAAAGDWVRYVDDDAKEAGDGLTWETAYRSLQDALDDARRAGAAGEIHVAGGRYAPDRGAGRKPGDRAATFEPVEGIVVRGGYRGLADGEDPDERDLARFETILTGDLAADDAPGFVNRADNSLHVVTAIDADATAGLDGLTIAGGHADGKDLDETGAGLFLKRASIVLVDCTIRDNLAAFQGGGLQGKEGSDAVFTRCRFTGNRALDNGGAVYLGESRPSFVECDFIANTATRYAAGACNRERSNATYEQCRFIDNACAEDPEEGGGGGAMVNAHSDPFLVGCLFEGNDARTGWGGALVNEPGFEPEKGGSHPTILSCTFIGNRAGLGGAIYDLESDPEIAYCTFESNIAVLGGGMYNHDSHAMIMDSQFISNEATIGDGGGGMWNDGGAPTVLACTFEANAAQRGGGLYNGTGNRSLIAECVFVGNRSSEDGGGLSNDSSFPTVVDCVFLDNVATGGFLTTGGGMSSYLSEPLVARCAFIGNAAHTGDFVGGGGMYNENGLGLRPVVVDCTFQANVSESGGGMYNFRSGPLVASCAFVENEAGAGGPAVGGGVYNDFLSSPVVTNCTFAENRAAVAGGMYSFRGAPVVTNSIVWGNVPGQIVDDGGAATTVRYSDIEGGWAGAGGRNLDADPRFVDLAAGDYRLAAGSPAIDAGLNAAVSRDRADADEDGDRRERLPRDVAGAPRFADDPATDDTGCGALAVVDLGAYEHAGTVRHPVVPGDLDADGHVNPDDLAMMLAAWGPCDEDECCPADLDVTGDVGFGDVIALLAHWR